MTKSKTQKNLKMKDSGVDWIGNIPSGWDIKKNKIYFKFEKGKDSGLYTKTYLGQHKLDDGFPVYSGQTESEGILAKIDTYKYNFQKGVLFTTTVGAKAMTPKFLVGKFSLSQNCALIVPRNNEKIKIKYFYYQLFTVFNRMKDDIPTHMQPSLRISDLGRVFSVFPPKQTQQKIVAFLDERTEAVAELVEKKKKMIELLKEKRSSLITHAVTCGLDDNGKLCQKPKCLPASGWKDSGVEWIGDIPSGWKMKKQKYLFRSISGKQKSENQISLENIESWTGKYIETDNEYAGDGMSFKKGDILFGKLRPYLAKVFLANKNGEALGDILVYRSTNEIIPKFGHKMLLSKNVIDYINASTYGTKMPRANPDFIRSLQMIYPPKQTQQKIVEFLDEKTSEIDSVISKIQKQIKLLDEYKASLIYYVVTGKIEV